MSSHFIGGHANKNPSRLQGAGRYVRLAAVACLSSLLSTGCIEWTNPFKPEAQVRPAPKVNKSNEPDFAPAPAVPRATEPVPEYKHGQLATDEPDDGPTMRSVREYVNQLDEASNPSPAASQPMNLTAAPPAGAPDSAAKKPILAPPAVNIAPHQQAMPPAEEPATGPAHATPKSQASAAPQVQAVGLVGDAKLAAPAPQQNVGLNRGLDATAPVQDATLERLIDQALTELRAAPSDADRQWRLSLLQLAAGRKREALTLSPALSSEAQTRLTQTLNAMIAAGKLHTDPNAAPDEVLAAVNELGGTLRNEAELRVPVVALCRKVVTFGVYDELPKNALLANRANRVIVYCEIENFSSKKESDGEFQTLLSSRMELFTAAGKSVWVAEEDKIEDRSRQRRQDFFLAQLVTLPADLAAGDYVLKVTITDLNAGKTNEGVLKFHMGT